MNVTFSTSLSMLTCAYLLLFSCLQSLGQLLMGGLWACLLYELKERIKLKSCELTFTINNVCKLTSHSKCHVSKESNTLEGHNSLKGTLNWHLKVIMTVPWNSCFIIIIFKLLMPPQGLNKGLNRGIFIIHSKLFPYFWLVKRTHIIHHNQLLLTKFGKNFVIMKRWHQNDVKSAAWLQVIEPVTKKTWGRGWVVLVVGTKCIFATKAS